jgi:hypothetical protein
MNTNYVTELPYPPPGPQGPQPVFMTQKYNPQIQYDVQKSYEATTEKRKGQKIKIAFYLAVLFALLSYNGTYRAVNMMYSAFTSKPFEIMSESGCPTTKGVLLHSAIFFGIVLFMLYHL